MTFFPLADWRRPPSSWSCVLGTVLVQVTAAREKKFWIGVACPVLSACPAAAAHKTMHTNAICKVGLGNLDFRLLHKPITGAG